MKERAEKKKNGFGVEEIRATKNVTMKCSIPRRLELSEEFVENADIRLTNAVNILVREAIPPAYSEYLIKTLWGASV